MGIWFLVCCGFTNKKSGSPGGGGRGGAGGEEEEKKKGYDKVGGKWKEGTEIEMNRYERRGMGRGGRVDRQFGSASQERIRGEMKSGKRRESIYRGGGGFWSSLEIN